jgi:GNAT superfamily N-acetyltransferase
VIRKLEISELEKVIHLGESFANAHGKIFNAEWFKKLWTGILSNGIGVILGLFENDECHGALCAIFYPDAITGNPSAMEAHWYMDPGKRGGGIHLFRAFEKLAKTRGCKTIQVGKLTDSSPLVEKFYLREGYSHKEMIFEKELSDGN